MISIEHLDLMAAEIFRGSRATGLAVACGDAKNLAIECRGRRLRKGAPLVDLRTFFDLQSITKVIATGEVFSEMIERSQVSFLDPLEKWIPELGPNLIAAGIRLDHLVTHSSGVSDGCLDGIPLRSDLLWKAMLNAKPSFPAGRGTEYTDVGYRLLGHALERAGHAKLNHLARELVWKPWGLSGKIKYANELVKTDAATGGDEAGCRRTDDEQVNALGEVLGCDGVFGTIEGVAIFCQRLLQRWKTSPRSRQSITNPVPPSSRFQNYFESLNFGKKAWSWEVPTHAEVAYCGRSFQNGVLEKAGAAGTFISFDPKRERFAILLTNHGKPNPFDERGWNQMIQQLKVPEIMEFLLVPEVEEILR